MKIKHNNILDIDKVSALYSEREGVDIKYICTTELSEGSDIPADVFYREKPHPEFGNRYFGLYTHPYSEALMIANADRVEDMYFAMVLDDNNELQYSRYRHDYRHFDNGNMIDGGRLYVRTNCHVRNYKIVNGEFVSYDE